MDKRDTHRSPCEVRIHLADLSAFPITRTNEPVTVGIPLPKGLSSSAAGWTVLSVDGRPSPLQTRVLDRWSDGSIRWALLDFKGTVIEGHAGEVTLALGGNCIAPFRPIALSQTGDTLGVDTGAALFSISPQAPSLFSEVSVNGVPAVDGTRSALAIITGAGLPARVTWRSPVVEEQGALRTVVRVDGDVACGRKAKLCLIARLHFFSDSPVVRMLLTVRNPHRARHPGGFWELGDAGSLLLKDVSIILQRPSAQPVEAIRCSIEPGASETVAQERMEVYQDSSGGENWTSSNHVNRDGIVPNTFRGYRCRVDNEERRGLRATPIVWLDSTKTLLGATLPHFWQNFPRAIRASSEALEIALFPAEYADLHELQGGEQKTHECYFSFGADRVTEMPLAWCRSRLLASASPGWYATGEAIPYLTPAASDPHHDYLLLANAAIEGPDTFEIKRESVDEYGWRHFGEIYGDHEAVRRTEGPPLVSHYNNQYDPILGFACQFFRSGNPRWWTQFLELAAHVVDIDIYHTHEDKAAYNNGLFWHTVHYVDAGKATHRSYPKAPGSNGGGPASEQNYTTGLLLHHLTTGDAASREAALNLAQFVIDMDDGTKTVFRCLDRGYTGHASASGSALYHGPGRGSGNSLNALLDGHRISGERKFLEKAEQIIRRAVHPAQDIEALNLADVERKWFYTMFLQALGKYLDHKAEMNELDVMYAYARASLLHFARWMARNENPYLDKPEILEFPTETWAAQDMRKSDVFRFAARHADGDQHSLFLERSAFFFNDSVARLKTMNTHTLARPVVLLLSHGFAHACSRTRQAMSAPPPAIAPLDFGAPSVFVPQKARLKRRAKLLATAVAILGAAAIVTGAVIILT